MPPETLFISDLHLSAARPETTRRFLRALRKLFVARRAAQPAGGSFADSPPGSASTPSCLMWRFRP
ncbi:MAG: hypothetical protein ACKN9T_11910, partial [Candidatus Methylumidiphilus sp.]